MEATTKASPRMAPPSARPKLRTRTNAAAAMAPPTPSAGWPAASGPKSASGQDQAQPGPTIARPCTARIAKPIAPDQTRRRARRRDGGMSRAAAAAEEADDRRGRATSSHGVSPGKVRARRRPRPESRRAIARRGSRPRRGTRARARGRRRKGRAPHRASDRAYPWQVPARTVEHAGRAGATPHCAAAPISRSQRPSSALRTAGSPYFAKS